MKRRYPVALSSQSFEKNTGPSYRHMQVGASPTAPLSASDNTGTMASDTKGERADDPSSSGSTEGTAPISVPVATERRQSGYDLAESGVAAEAPAGSDDEDVSLDELMMSDSSEEDEESAPQPAAPQERAISERAAPGVEGDSAAGSAMESAAPAAAMASLPDGSEVSAAPAADGLAELLEAEALQARYVAEQDAGASTATELTADNVDPDPNVNHVIPTEGSWFDEDGTDTATPPPPLPEAVAFDPGATGPFDAVVDTGPALPPVRVETAAAPSRPPASLFSSGAAVAPLPSFDIPEAAPAQRGSLNDSRSRTGPRPITPLPPLSELGEDDDDAVTHIGLPVTDMPGDYARTSAEGFRSADPSVAAMHAFDPSSSLADSRRATTRVIPRVDLSASPPGAAPASPPGAAGGGLAGIGHWFSNALSGARAAPAAPYASAPAAAAPHSSAPPPRGAAWWVENVLPPLCYLLLGSGLGAVITVLQSERGISRAEARAVQPLEAAPDTLEGRARSGDGEALFEITNMPAAERESALTLALEEGYRVRRQSEYREFAKGLHSEPQAEPAELSRFVDFATSPETMLQALGDLSAWAGPQGPDVLYAVWEKAPGGSRAANLALQLLQAKDQRAKASPALLAALELRAARSCEDYLRVLPTVKRDGDQRCSSALRALKHTDGCGNDGQQDCYPCLRDGAQLDDALQAIERRPAPEL